MKKRLLSIALIASLVLSVAGCGETDSSESVDNISTTVANNSDVAKTTSTFAETTAEITTTEILNLSPEEQAQYDVAQVLKDKGFFNYEIIVNGDIIKLPISTKKLMELGYVIPEGEFKDKERLIEANKIDNTYIRLTNSESGIILYIYGTKNTSNNSLDLVKDFGSENLIVYELMFGRNANAEYGIEVELDFMEGISFGASREEIINIFGEPYKNERSVCEYRENPLNKNDKSSISFIREDSSTNSKLDRIVLYIDPDRII